MMVGSDPKLYQEASHDPICKTTMQEEFNSLQENETWEFGSFASQEEASEMQIGI